MEKKILGIDPGSHYLGAGCIVKNGNSMKLLFAEVITAPPKKNFYDRLEVISARVDELLDLHSPDEIALEDSFFGKNAKSAFQLGVTRGVILGNCLKRKIKIFEYPPAKVKLVVAGHGRADKAQVQKMVELTIGDKIALRYDATDALAVAICHAYTMKLELLTTGISAKRLC